MTIPGFLIEEQVLTKNGEGAALELPRGTALVELTLGIVEGVEQQALDLNIHGSPDGSTWSPKPIAAFPQKFYAGTTKILLDPSQHPEVRYVRAQWKLNRWGNWPDGPRFQLYVFAAPVD